MKKLAILVLVLMLAMSGVSAFAQDLGAPVTMRVSLSAASTEPHAMGSYAFKEYVEKTSNGNITVEVYSDSVLFTQEEEVVAVAANDAQMVLTAASWLTTGSPWIGMLGAGYTFKTYDHMNNVLNGEIGKEIFARVAEEQGIMPLGSWYRGSRQISLSQDKHIKVPADLNGINLRMPNSDAWLELGRAIGANPTPISFSELYLALQTGVVDGQDNPLPTLESAKFYEVQKSVSLTNHMVDSIWPTVSFDFWNSLTDAQKQIIIDGVEEGRKVCDQINLDGEATLIEFFKEQGLSVYEADIDAFAEHVTQFYLDSPTSQDWDLDLLKKIQDAA